jgi:hypothetical protein
LTVPKYQTGDIGVLRVAVVEDQLFEISDELLLLRLRNPRILSSSVNYLTFLDRSLIYFIERGRINDHLGNIA